MGYADVSTVSRIAGITTSEVMSVYLHLADNYVEELVGYDMDRGIDNQIDYFDVENRNMFVANYDRTRNFVLTRKPVRSIISITADVNGSPTVLELNVDYFVDYENGIVSISGDCALEQGKRNLKIRYSWGYGGDNDIPLIVRDFANYMCAMLHDLNNNVVKNVDGKPLKEIELGRWKEIYDTSGSSIKAKYSLLNKLEATIINKYKVWP